MAHPTGSAPGPDPNPCLVDADLGANAPRDYDFSTGERGRFFHRNARRILPVPDATGTGPDRTAS